MATQHTRTDESSIRSQQQQNINSNIIINNRKERKSCCINPQAQTLQPPEKPSPQNSEEEVWCEIKEIIAENKTKYRIVWAGEDPATGQPWKPEWKRKTEVTEDAVKEWEWDKQVRKEVRKRNRGRDSGNEPPKKKRGRLRKDILPPLTQSSEYAPSQVLSDPDKVSFNNEIGDSFCTSLQEVFVVIKTPRGFDRDQYKAYTNSNIELLSQQVIVERHEKEVSSQGSGKVILVYKRAAVIPNSQSITSGSLKQGGLLELHSYRAQRAPETQVEAESQGPGDTLEAEGEAQAPVAQSGSPQTSIQSPGSTSWKVQPQANLQTNNGQQEPQITDLQTPLAKQEIFGTASTGSHEILAKCQASTASPIRALPLESLPQPGQDLIKATPGIEPHLLAPEQIYKPLKSAEAQSDHANTAFTHREQSPRASSLGTETSALGSSEKPPIEAFQSWFTNHRREPRPAATRALTPKAKRSRGHSSSFPVSQPATAVSCSKRYLRHSLPPSMKVMSNNNTSTSTPAVSGVAALRERLARSREERNAKVAATRNARNAVSMSPYSTPSLKTLSRSPSTAPVENVMVGPVVAISANPLGAEKTSQHSVLAVSQSFPQTVSPATQDRDIFQTQSSMAPMNATPFGPPQLGPAEYVIGLPLRTKSITPDGIDQKKAYLNSIVGKHIEIQQFLSNPDAADTALIKTMQDVVETSGRIATHPDLPFDKVGISAAAAGKEAEYHAAMSSKFVFLRAFLGAVKGQFLKIVIVAEEGKLIDILEIFLRGLKVCYTRLDRLSTLPRIPDDDLDGLVKVFLLPSSKSGAVTNAADCLIAMDSTFDSGLPEIKGFRNNIVEVEKLAPVIRLVAINTIEQLRLCCAPGQEIPLHVYVETLKNLRLQVGSASQEYGSAISRAPTKISKWLQKKAEGALDIPAIPELPLFELATQQLQSATTSPPDGSDKRKRQEDNMGTQTTDFSVSQPLEIKRLRVHDPEPSSSLSAFSQQQGDITHISDSVPSRLLSSTSARLLETSEPEPEQEFASSPMDLESEEEKEGGEVMLEENRIVFGEPLGISDETGIGLMSREDLVCTLKKKMDELRQWMGSTGRLQVRHEELRGAFLEAKKGLQKSQKAQKDAETRKERMSNELMKVKAERIQLQTDLVQARNRLLAGPPEIAQLEQLRAENEKLKERLHSAENNAQTKERDFDFLRDQYQQASNGAFELRGDNDRLRKENSILEKRSDEVVVRLRALQLENQVLTRDKHIENLSLQLKEREERISRLEHERAVNTRSRGSVGMRASSVSIRGSPIQSRATSPATGVGFHGRESSTHPLRNG